LLILLVSLFFVLFILKKVYPKKIWQLYPVIITIVVFSSLFLGNIVSFHASGRTIIDRLGLQNEENISTITNRVKLAENAIEISSAYPLFGTGTGTYQFYNTVNKAYIPTTYLSSKTLMELSSNDPHNIFLKTLAESGIVGLVSFSLLLGYFLQSDFKSLGKKDLLLGSYIFVFWSHFTYALFNPSSSLVYQSFFWFIRGIIMQLNITSKSP
ncbi:O-antigen ligase family protein, partial [Candidatus Roizmanbacteria bacterium]|nr:O-antigen ligase family protein [Candidatus Roizmanbacteria bacterium]